MIIKNQGSLLENRPDFTFDCVIQLKQRYAEHMQNPEYCAVDY